MSHQRGFLTASGDMLRPAATDSALARAHGLRRRWGPPGRGNVYVRLLLWETPICDPRSPGYPVWPVTNRYYSPDGPSFSAGLGQSPEHKTRKLTDKEISSNGG